jgi:hypothetical protein
MSAVLPPEGRNYRWTGAVLLALALALGAAGIVWLSAGPGPFGTDRSPKLRTPLERTLSLSEGRYTVYERVIPAEGPARPEPGGLEVPPETIEVRGPTGERLEVTGTGVREVYDGFESVAHVRIPADGDYHFTIPATDGVVAEVYVAHGLSDMLARALRPGLVLFGGLVIGAVGLVFFAAGLTRRRAVPRPARPPRVPRPPRVQRVTKAGR